jgi:hypothetical protein
MPKRNAFLGSMLSIGLLLGSLAYAQKGNNPPPETVNGKKHPNLAAAQRLCDQAYEKISAGQQANEWDMEGHAAKAKELLDQASKEIKEAAVASNKGHKQGQ